MTGIAMAVVLVSALLHACWNFLAKKSLKKIVFIWWSLLASMVLYFPMLVWFWPASGISPKGWVFVAATGITHFFYFFFLGSAYEQGDLSLVYPLSRGAAPLVVPVTAVIFLGEAVSFLGGTGIALVVAGIYVIHLRSFSGRSFLEPVLAVVRPASAWALLTGMTIAAYSLIDKAGVAWVYPPVYIYLMIALAWLCLTPFVLVGHRRHIMPEWRANASTVAVVSILMLASYLLILFALRIANVGYIIAVREISIVFSVLFGLYRLGEANRLQKLLGSAIITAGVVCIGLSR